MAGMAGTHLPGIALPRCGALERAGKIEVAGDKARRVGIGDVAGDHLLAMRAQLQRVRHELHPLGQLL